MTSSPHEIATPDRGPETAARRESEPQPDSAAGRRGSGADRRGSGAGGRGSGSGRAGSGVVVAVLVAVGVFCLGLALLLPLVVYPRLAVQPADPDIHQIQTTNDGTAMIVDLSSPAGVRVRSHVPILIDTYITQARQKQATEGNVVWQLGTRVEAAGRLLQARIETVSLDKRTAQPSNCCGDDLATVQDQPARSIHHTGLVTFPFNTQKRDYQVWDVNLNRARTGVYSGTSRRDGMLVYTYTASNDWTDVGSQSLPGSLFGVKDPSVDATGQYRDRRTYFVEPTTGSTLGVEEQLDQRFVFNGRSITAISAHLESPSLPGHRLTQIRTGIQTLPWLRGRASIVLGVVALTSFAGAGLLARRRRPN